MKTNSKKQQISEYRWFWLIIVGMILISLGIFGSNIIESNQDSSPDNGTTVLQNAFAVALRKCAVMEAIDVYIAGDYGNQNSVFNYTLESCYALATDEYSGDVEEFINDVNEGWSLRKDEQLDGKNLEYYLNNLDWQN